MKNQERFTDIESRLSRIELELGLSIRTWRTNLRSAWAYIRVRKLASVTVAALVVAVLTLGYMVYSDWERARNEHEKEDFVFRVGEAVDAKLKEPLSRIDKISNDSAEIKGRLGVLGPLLQQLIKQEMEKSSSLTDEQFKRSLPEIKAVLASAREGKIAIDPATVEKTGRRVIAEAARQPLAWQTALACADYRSFLNFLTPPDTSAAKVASAEESFKWHGRLTINSSTLQIQLLIGPTVPAMDGAIVDKIGENANPGTKLAPAFLDYRLAFGSSVLLDGEHLKNVIFENARVVYQGGPMVLENVIFINCTFDVPQSQSGEQLLAGVLSSPSVSVPQKKNQHG